MISYEKANIISMRNLEDFIVAKGYNSNSVWNAFAEGVENNSYNYWDLEMLHDAIEIADYHEHFNEIPIYNCVIEAIRNGEIPNEFLLNVFW